MHFVGGGGGLSLHAVDFEVVSFRENSSAVAASPTVLDAADDHACRTQHEERGHA